MRMTVGSNSAVAVRSVVAIALIAGTVFGVHALENDPSFKQDWSAPAQAAPAKRSRKYDELMATGRKHLRNRRYVEAHDAFYSALKLEPGDEECNRELISFWETMVRLNPTAT